MDFYTRALELKQETITHRRYFHSTAEVGLDMPMARKYVMDTLQKYGIHAETCGHGITALIGHGEPTILLRADMDALPMAEKSGEDFAASGGTAHTCGHDLHAAMLLTAAKMLKECEDQLRGTVKLMFQPAEETFEGSQDMIENGILENPSVDAALAFHVAPGQIPLGIFMYNSHGVMMNSVDGFRIEIAGKGGHGAYPNLAIDPIQIGVHIYQGLEALIAREADPEKTCVLSVGKFQAGNAANIIPDNAVLEGTLRTNDPACREKLVKRIQEMAEGTAKIYGGSAEVIPLSKVAPLICDPELTEQMVGFMTELHVPGIKAIPEMKANASEDFANIAEKVPSAFMYLSAGFMDERGAYSAHNPKVRFNEDVLPIGAAGLVHCAVRYLEDNI